jgi:non-specific serine/threonine protein kinase
MLETIHEYARLKLQASGETEDIGQRHAHYFVTLAEVAQPELRMAPHARWFRRFELEMDNLREVFVWSFDHRQVELGVRLAGAIWLFWYAYGHHREGRQWTQRLLPFLDEIPVELHGRFLIAAGNMAMSGDFSQAESLFLRALDVSRQQGDALNSAWALIHLASVSSKRARAMAIGEEALALFRALDHQPGVAHALNIVGEIARQAGDDDYARRAYEECLEVCLRTGESRRIALMYFNLAFLAQHEGDHLRSLNAARHALQIARDMNNRGEMAWGLPLIAGSLAALGQAERAAQLLGMSRAFQERLGSYIMPADQQEFDRIRAEVRTQLGQSAFEAAIADGRKMTLDQAIALALESEG